MGQGLLAYLLAQEPNLTDKVIDSFTSHHSSKWLLFISYLFSQGVVVGFDGRHNSRRWAFLTAGVFIRAKVTIRVYTLTNTLLEYDNC